MSSIDFEYEKKVIGYLIHYYRKELGVSLDLFLKNEKKFYHENCLECKKCKNLKIICGKKKLYEIEKGNIPKKDCYFHRLCENLNKKFVLDWRMIRYLDRLRDEVIKNIVDYSHTNLKRLADILEVQLEKHRGEIYVEERLRLYKDVVEYKVNKKVPSEKAVELYKCIKEIIEENDRDIIFLFLFELTFKIVNISRDELVECCKPFIDHPLLFKIKLYSYNTTNQLEYYEILKNYIFSEKKDFTKSQMYMLYENMTLALLNLGSYEKAYQTISVCLNILEEGADLGKYTKVMCYNRAAIISYSLGNFTDVVTLLLKVADYDKNNLGFNIVLLANSLEKINRIDELIQLLETINLDEIYNENVKKVIIYYKYKHLIKNKNKKNYSDLEDYICFALKSIYSQIGEIYMNIFKEDLLFFADITTNYKKLHIFEKNISK